MQREHLIEQSKNHTFDALIIGAGINGASVSAALSANGLKVCVIDKGDFASLTSQESSNLIWGGIKYLENYEFHLVKKLCDSRNVLMQSYPSSLKEIRFLVSHQKKFRYPLSILYAGAWLYWFLGSRFTKKPILYSLSKLKSKYPILNTKDYDGGFEYSDAYILEGDSRFSFQFIKNTLDNGSIPINYLKASNSSKKDDLWETEVEDMLSSNKFKIKSKVIINALGPYSDLYNNASKQKTNFKHILSKGIHLIVDKVIDEIKVLSFFANDGRLFFIMPMDNRTCVGTTDTPVKHPTKEITDEDVDFVLENINEILNLSKPITKSDIISTRCGVRPLVVKSKTKNSNQDWMQLSRKHETEINLEDKYITLFGGKLTNCINIGDEICDIFSQFKMDFPKKQKKWYGEPTSKLKEEFLQKARDINLDEFCDSNQEKTSERFWRKYTLDSFEIVKSIEKKPELKKTILNTDVYAYNFAEIEYLAEKEMIVNLEDFLRRRTNLSLLYKKTELEMMEGLKEINSILFKENAKLKWENYFNS